MAIIASSKGSSTPREPIAAGAYAARCYSIIDLGTREETIQGSTKVLRKIRVTFELPTERRIFNEDKGEQPCVISKEFNLSLNEKSSLRGFLKSWRGKDFTEQEAAAFDVAKLIGAPCLLNIIHVAGKANPGRMYDEISSVSPLPKGMVCPPQENPSFEFSLDEFDKALFETLPKFIQEKVSTSFEYIAMTSKAAPAFVQPAPNPALAPQFTAPDPIDELPF